MIGRGRARSGWRAATWAGIALYVLLSIAYLFLGQINDDEGWYLYAGKLVFEGQLPYRDFSYTQMPLLPYIYGLPQLVLPRSILLGRVTSVAFSLATLALSLSLAHKYAEARGTGLTALLLATFSYGIYFSSIVKTYSFLSFAFALTFWILASDLPDAFKYPLALIPGFAAAMTRLSAVLFLLPVLLYCLKAARSRGALAAVVLVLGILGTGSAILLTRHPDNSIWNLLTYHSLPWVDVPIVAKLARILLRRIPDVIQFYDVYLFLLLPPTLVVWADRGTRTALRAYIALHPPLWIVGAGLGLFSLSHLAAGGWHIEYLSPAVVAAIPLIAITVRKVVDLADNRAATVLLWGVLLAALLVPLARHGVQHIRVPGRDLTLQEVDEISALLTEHTEPSEPILALQALWAVIGADRSVLPGLSMSQFSYHDVSTDEARRLGLVNGEIIVEYVQSCAAPVVVLTDLDWRLLTQTGHDRAVVRALVDRYERVLSKTTSRWPGTLEVYVCGRN